MLFIIAECAQGYLMPCKNESVELAKMLVRSAKSAGVDAVKFQLIVADELSTDDYKYFELFKKLEIGYEGFKKVCDLANEINIEVIFDVFGPKSLSIAESLNIKTIKIHPTDFTNFQLLEMVEKSKKIEHIIAGCGGAFLKEINPTLKKLGNKKRITLLHGFQGYPTPLEDNCLDRISHLTKIASNSSGEVLVGFADHCDPDNDDATQIASLAIGFGARVLEKHLTLARCLKLEDSESALSPDEMKEFIKIIRGVSNSFIDRESTSDDFHLPNSELKYRESFARHVVSTKYLSKGHLVTTADICMKRSSSASPILSKEQVLGKTLSTAINKNKPIEKTNLL